MSEPGLYLINSTGEMVALHTESGSGDTQLLREYLDENGLSNGTGCNGCGREVTLMGNGYCGLCQDKVQE